MLDYIEDIEKASKNKEERIVYNKGPKHASIFMTELLTNARQNVKIYSEQLNKDVTQNDFFMDAFRNIIINKNISVHIILEKESNNPIIKELLKEYAEAENNQYNNHLTIGINDHVKTCLKDIFEQDTTHFTVIDQTAYRIEDNVKDFKAYGSFNDTDFAQHLDKYFLDCLNKNTITK
jgi:2-hydroxy-3-keto-5-methylthiopentenyl-1-phosphate phosphatase